MTVKIIKKSKGEGTTNIKPPHGAEIEKKHKTQSVVTDGTTIGFKVGHTMNLGNFESAKFEVWLELPTTAEKVNDDFKICQEWADEKLAAVVQEAKEEIE